MSLHKSTVKFNYNKKRGSVTIYCKKEFAEKFMAQMDKDTGEILKKGFIPNTDQLAIYNDEKGELCIKEL